MKLFSTLFILIMGLGMIVVRSGESVPLDHSPFGPAMHGMPEHGNMTSGGHPHLKCLLHRHPHASRLCPHLLRKDDWEIKWIATECGGRHGKTPSYSVFPDGFPGLHAKEYQVSGLREEDEAPGLLQMASLFYTRPQPPPPRRV